MILVTGGAGFIGSAFVRMWLEKRAEPVTTLDLLTYAGNMANLSSVMRDERHVFVRGDIADRACVDALCLEYQPRAIINFAAESHVDRSIAGATSFIRTNVVGTFNLLESARTFVSGIPADAQREFRFLHVSTDEVYGSLDPAEPPFSESHRYAPNSPYAASKAASDHLVRAWQHTYAFPTLTTNCSNNYGPFHFPEKLIPLTILSALNWRPLPIYGDGQQVRDWLYVEDHCRAIMQVLDSGRIGETYNIGGRCEQRNIDVVRMICHTLDDLIPRRDGRSYATQISFVEDRPGHDRRYAIDPRKIEGELGWRPRESFASGIRKTIQWYLDNQEWIEGVTSGAYQHWIGQHYRA